MGRQRSSGRWLTSSPHKVVAVVLLALGLLGSHLLPMSIGQLGYSAFSLTGQAWMAVKFRHFESLAGPRFDVRHDPIEDGSTMAAVLSVAEAIYPEVEKVLGWELPDRVTLIVHPTRQSIASAFPVNRPGSAVGAYWASQIHLLSPAVWLQAGSPDEIREELWAYGPIAHELTHGALDLRLNGHYPRWFSEGLAQYVEYKVTGYAWVEPGDSISAQAYPFEVLVKDFDTLEDQAIAYRQAFLLMVFILDKGNISLSTFLDRLDQGGSVAELITEVLGAPLAEVEEEWLRWVSEKGPSWR